MKWYSKAMVGMSIYYRNAVAEDEGDIFTLASTLATSFILNKGDFSTIYLDLLNDINVDIVIAEKESDVIGYVLVFHHPTFYANGLISWVEELFVLDELRRTQIGKSLMELVEQKARDRGSKLIALATRRASDFYKSIGYDESAIYFKKNISKA